MGGNYMQKKAHSSFSLFSFFKSKKGRKGDLYNHVGTCTEVSSISKVWPSDEDKGPHWIAEPGIDRKAKDYIDRIHRNLTLETEGQIVNVHPSRRRLDL